jgi:enamine deaminase RidA (YjgF/YER057c/UK114 family)
MIHFSRRCSLFALCFLLGGLVVSLHAQDGAFKVIKVDSKDPGVASSSGVLSNGTLYVAGQNGRNADGSVPSEFQQEVSQSMRSVQDVLLAAKMDFGNVVWMNIFVTRAQDIAKMNEVYWRSIGADPPARSVIVVGALPNRENIEINCIAVSNAGHRQVIRPPGWPQGPNIDPAGIQVDDLLYMSAQEGADPVTGKLAGDYASEVKQALDNVGTILKSANMSMENVVWVNPYMASTEANLGTQNAAGPIAHNGQVQQPQAVVMNKIYASYFEFGNTPARGTMPVVDLPHQAHIVLSCIAGADLTKRKSIRPKNMELSATASPGILYGDTYYMSGKSGFIPDQGIVTPDVELQLRQSMRNLLDDLQETNLDFSDVVSATIYLREIKDMDPVQTLYAKFFKDHFPARTTMQNNFDMKTLTGEQISFIAVRQPKH